MQPFLIVVWACIGLLVAGNTDASGRSWVSSERTGVAAVSAVKRDLPAICRGVDCPIFRNVTEKGDKFETRDYDEGRWITIRFYSPRSELVALQGAVALMSYFRGANEDYEKLPPTTPLVIRFLPTADFRGTSPVYYVAAFFPFDYQVNGTMRPPEPLSSALRVVHAPNATIYARAFNGIALQEIVLRNARQLRDDLADAKADFDDRAFFLAIYDPLLLSLERRNEVWFAGKKQGNDTLGFSWPGGGGVEPAAN